MVRQTPRNPGTVYLYTFGWGPIERPRKVDVLATAHDEAFRLAEIIAPEMTRTWNGSLQDNALVRVRLANQREIELYYFEQERLEDDK